MHLAYYKDSILKYYFVMYTLNLLRTYTVKKALKALFKEFGENIVTVYIYGSVARGDCVESSDVNVHIVLKDNVKLKETTPSFYWYAKSYVKKYMFCIKVQPEVYMFGGIIETYCYVQGDISWKDISMN